MKLLLICSLPLMLTAISCAHAPAQPQGLEKYPQCYHANVKISKKCVEMNEAGEPTTAGKLENTAYPGQYK